MSLSKKSLLQPLSKSCLENNSKRPHEATKAFQVVFEKKKNWAVSCRTSLKHTTNSFTGWTAFQGAPQETNGQQHADEDQRALPRTPYSLMEVFFDCHVWAIPGLRLTHGRPSRPSLLCPWHTEKIRKDSFTVCGAARSPIDYWCWDSCIWTSKFVLNSWSNSSCTNCSRPSTESYWIYRTYTYWPRIGVNGNLAAHFSFVWSDWRYESPNSYEAKRCTDGLNPVLSQSTEPNIPIDRSSTSRNWSPKVPMSWLSWRQTSHPAEWLLHGKVLHKLVSSFFNAG